jgi:hypothetical protein
MGLVEDVILDVAPAIHKKSLGCVDPQRIDPTLPPAQRRAGHLERHAQGL